jgi:hypothetical protein
MTNLKHTHLSVPHFTVIIGLQYLDHSPVLVIWESFMISSKKGICVVLGNFECDSYA